MTEVPAVNSTRDGSARAGQARPATGDACRAEWQRRRADRPELIRRWWGHTGGRDRLIARRFARSGDYLPDELREDLIAAGLFDPAVVHLPMPDDVRVQVLARSPVGSDGRPRRR